MPAGKLDSAAPPDDAPHLLLVDDDRRIRDLLSRFLRAKAIVSPPRRRLRTREPNSRGSASIC